MDGPPIHGNTRLEIIWTAIPAILLVALCTYAYVVLTDIEEAPRPSTMDVRVVGEQFTWTFYYRGDGGKEIASPQLYLPRDRPVHFTVQSKDVLHDFWVPAFRMKIDAVRGHRHASTASTPTRLGDYPVVCAELCGLGHATMRQTAHVVEPRRVRHLARRAARRRPPAAARGRRREAGGGGGRRRRQGRSSPAPAGCGACHTLADAGTTGTTGPDLDEVAQAGKDEAFIKQSIVDPNAEIAEGFHRRDHAADYGRRWSRPSSTRS